MSKQYESTNRDTDEKDYFDVFFSILYNEREERES